MRAGRGLALAFHPADVFQCVEKLGFQCGREVHPEIFFRIMQQSIQRGFPVIAAYQQPIRHQLQAVRVIGSLRGIPGLDFHGYQITLAGFHHIVRFADNAELRVQKRFGHPLPEVAIRVDDPCTGQPALFALAQAQEQQNCCHREQKQHKPPCVVHRNIQSARQSAAKRATSASHL